MTSLVSGPTTNSQLGGSTGWQHNVVTHGRDAPPYRAVPRVYQVRPSGQSPETPAVWARDERVHGAVFGCMSMCSSIIAESPLFALLLRLNLSIFPSQNQPPVAKSAYD